MINLPPFSLVSGLNPDLIRLYELVFNQTLAKSDAIIWLQGDRLDRGQKVLDLYQGGFAKTIVITGNNTLVGPNLRPGENDLSVDDLVIWLKNHGVPSANIILETNSLNTAEQAKNVILLAKEKGWKHVILVSSPYHQPRAFLTFLQQQHLNPNLKFINQPALDLSWNEWAGGRVKTRIELVRDEALKIFTLTQDVAQPRMGIEYLAHYEN